MEPINELKKFKISSEDTQHVPRKILDNFGCLQRSRKEIDMQFAELLATSGSNLNYLKNWNNFWGIKSSTAMQKIEIDRTNTRKKEEEEAAKDLAVAAAATAAAETEKLESPKGDKVTKRLSWLELKKLKEKEKEKEKEEAEKNGKIDIKEALLEEDESASFSESDMSASAYSTDLSESEGGVGGMDFLSVSLPLLPPAPKLEPPQVPTKLTTETTVTTTTKTTTTSNISPVKPLPPKPDKPSRRDTPKVASSRSPFATTEFPVAGSSSAANNESPTGLPTTSVSSDFTNSVGSASSPNIPLPPLPASVPSSPTKLMSFIPSLVARHYHQHPKLKQPPMVENFYGKFFVPYFSD